jgi:hypothetical protein
VLPTGQILEADGCNTDLCFRRDTKSLHRWHQRGDEVRKRLEEATGCCTAGNERLHPHGRIGLVEHDEPARSHLPGKRSKHCARVRLEKQHVAANDRIEGLLKTAASATASVLSGWVCDRWMQAGAGTDRVRMSAILTGLAGVAACLGLCAIAGPLGSLLAMVGCGVFLGILVPAYFASAQTLAGPGAAARWFGVQNFVANIAGISAPVITGVVVDRTGSFSSAFLIAAVLPSPGSRHSDSSCVASSSLTGIQLSAMCGDRAGVQQASEEVVAGHAFGLIRYSSLFATSRLYRKCRYADLPQSAQRRTSPHALEYHVSD